jgi:hypothetical protein
VTGLHAVPDLPDADLDALEQAVDTGLATAIASLTRLRELHAHTRRGFEHWHSYVLWRFGEHLRLLRLPDEERRALVESMSTPTSEHRKGIPVREQATLLGIAPGTVQADRRSLGLVIAKEQPEPLPAPEGKVWQQTAEYLARAGDRGLTLLELAGKASWSEGKASGALSYLWARYAADKSDQIRDRQTAYVLTDVSYVARRPQQI